MANVEENPCKWKYPCIWRKKKKKKVSEMRIYRNSGRDFETCHKDTPDTGLFYFCINIEENKEILTL